MFGTTSLWPEAVADLVSTMREPGDVASLRDAVLAGDVRCLLLDAETDPAWAETLGEGAALRTATVDPDGVTLTPGPGLYPQLMTGLAAALEACLAPAG
jgi:zinc transport system substrate-binding protein